MTPLLDSVIEVTGYNDGTALWRPGSSIALASDIERKLPDLTVPLDAIYVQNRMPLIYFTAAADNETDLRHLHQQLWNYNQGFLLVAVQQETAHFVDCFQAPSKDPIIRSVPAPTHPDHVTALLPFSRGELLSGRTTAHFPWFSLADRVDRHLFNNLEGLRNRLQNAHLDRSTANALVIRSLLIRYLEDRHVLQNLGEPRYMDVLFGRASGVFAYYRRLADLFNGDVLAILPDEEDNVSDSHLHLIANWLSATDMHTGQQSFWPYDFSFIPPELLSGVYQTLVGEHPETSRQSGTFYTPRVIVAQVLDATWEVTQLPKEPTVLDPTCGSGAFLAAAFRRMVNDWGKRNPGTPLSAARASSLLTSQIFGGDIDPDAVRLAALSCYLVMLDSLPLDAIRQDFRFPRLLGRNFQTGDFFDESNPLAHRQYDVIVGNPPWGRGRVNGQTIALESFERAVKWLVPEGIVAMVLPARWLYTRRAAGFRQRVAETCEISEIIDFTALRHVLFAKATAPGVVLVARRAASIADQPICFLVAEATPMAKISPYVPFLSHQRHSVARSETFPEPAFWKGLRMGTMRPWIMLESLRRRFPTLGEIIGRQDWAHGKGITPGSLRSKRTPLPPGRAQLKYLSAKAVQWLDLNEEYAAALPPVANRWRSERLYHGPLVLVNRGSQTQTGRFRVAYTSSNYFYSNEIWGIAGSPDTADLLRGLTVLLSSSVAGFMLYLLSANWGVERGAIEPNELLSLPCPSVSLSLEEFDQMRTGVMLTRQQKSWDRIDRWGAQQYGLTPEEVTIIDEFIDFQRFHHDRTPNAKSPLNAIPRSDMLDQYVLSLSRTLENTIIDSRRDKVYGRVVTDNWPIYAVGLAIEPKGMQGNPLRLPEEFRDNDTLIDETWREGRAVRFDHETAWLFKIPRGEFWTQTAALNDADWFVAQLLVDDEPSSLRNRPRS